MNIIILIVYFIFIGILGILSIYFGLKSLANLAENSKGNWFKVSSLGIMASDKYFNDKGKLYRKKLKITSFLIFILTILLFIVRLNF